MAAQATKAASIKNEEKEMMGNMRVKSQAMSPVGLKAVHTAAVIQALRAFAMML